MDVEEIERDQEMGRRARHRGMLLWVVNGLGVLLLYMFGIPALGIYLTKNVMWDPLWVKATVTHLMDPLDQLAGIWPAYGDYYGWLEEHIGPH